MATGRSIVMIAMMALLSGCFTSKIDRKVKLDAVSDAVVAASDLADGAAPDNPDLTSMDLIDAQEPDASDTLLDADVTTADLVAETSSPYPQCSERGGSCLSVNSLGDSCPEGTYAPFSGSSSACPTSSPQLCCVPTKTGGAPCTGEADCTQASCLREASGYPPGGMCSMGTCSPDVTPSGCASWQRCLTVTFSAAPGVCLVACNRDGHCRAGWSCQAMPRKPFVPGARETAYVCWAPVSGSKGVGQSCQQDSECLSANCLVDPQTQSSRCAASCNAQTPCLPDYSCRKVAGCSGDSCEFCFPN